MQTRPPESEIDLVNASADLTTVAVDRHTAALEQVGNRSNRFTVVLRDAADREDQITQTWAGAGRFFEGLFHSLGSVESFLESMFSRASATLQIVTLISYKSDASPLKLVQNF